jgi:CHAD domain-containing protein
MKTRWNGSANAAANASKRLPALLVEYFRAGREVVEREDAAAAELHGFRLATKRLRYTLELFRPCYGEAFEERLRELHQIQQFLGDANDSAAAGRLIGRLLPGKQRRAVEKFLADRGASDTARFRAYWREEFDAPGRERAWMRYLG